MDKAFSTRLDEATLDKLNRVTRAASGSPSAGFSKEAIRLRAEQSGAADDSDVWAETLGA